MLYSGKRGVDFYLYSLYSAFADVVSRFKPVPNSMLIGSDFIWAFLYKSIGLLYIFFNQDTYHGSNGQSEVV